MAYTITFKNSAQSLGKVLDYLRDRMAKENRFRATFTPGVNRRGQMIIVVRTVRLVKAKPYCGNHPGECVVNPYLGVQKKKVMTHLEWDDWVRFHAMVNRVLNRFRVDADVWSEPHDVKGKMWIRRGRVARKRYDYSEEYVGGSVPLRIWNQGTPDQF